MANSHSSTPQSSNRAFLSEAVRMVENAVLVALDMETTSLDPRGGEVRLVQVSDGDYTYVIDCRRVDPRVLLDVLKSKTVLAHHAAFEYQWVYKRYGVELVDIRDTMLMAQVLACGDMSISTSLETLAETELEIELDKEMQDPENWALDVELTRRHLEYAAKDAQILIPLFAVLSGELAKEDLERVAQLENAALPATARMMLAGVPFDKEGWDRAAHETEEELKALEREMLELNGLPEPKPIPQQWHLTGDDCLAMLHAAGVEVEGTTAKDLKPLADKHELVRRLLAYRKAKGEEREAAKEAVYAIAPKKPPKPAPAWNFGSPHQVQEICESLLGSYLKSVDEANLLRFVEEHPFFEMMLRYRKLSKRVGTYGVKWAKDAYDELRGRIYPKWRQIGTSTGRFSCNSPNLQNIPHDLRRFIVAPPGRMLVSVDYSQIEVRIYAKLVEEQALIDLFERNADIYKSTAANLLDIPEYEVTKEQRRKAKAIVLGVLYGMSEVGLPSYAFKNFGVKILPGEAKELIARFFELYPAIAADHTEVLEELRRTGSVDRETITGRRRDNITNRNEAINAPVQGSAADILKAAMVDVHRQLKRFKGSAFIIVSLHDELLVECNEADADEVLHVVEEAMVSAMDKLLNAHGVRVPVDVDGRVSKEWSKED
jgi:DNA polymerase I-like protein with 3'-5' exonuclease and polymerase domains